jgi:hypothetical protein
VSAAYGCAVENYGEGSAEAAEVEAEWKDLAKQAYLRAYPLAVDANDDPIPRDHVCHGPLEVFAQMKANRTREKAVAQK